MSAKEETILSDEASDDEDVVVEFEESTAEFAPVVSVMVIV